jgi:flagellar biosynthesis GTPase FlhF
MKTTTYRGRSLEEILPRIREELGPDAIVVRQRTGLTGGIGGFFQRQCVEVEARPGHPRIDVYDEPPEEEARRPRQAKGRRKGAAAGANGNGRAAKGKARRNGRAANGDGRVAKNGAVNGNGRARAAAAPNGNGARANGNGAAAAQAPVPADDALELRNDAATRDGLGSPGVQKLIEQAQPFAEKLQRAIQRPLVAGRRAPEEARLIEQELVDAGLRREIAASVVAETVSHLLPFGSPNALRDLAREALARRIRVAPAWVGQGRELALVGLGGSGKTACVARIAQAYAAGSDLPVVCMALRPRDGGAALRERLEEWGVEVEVFDRAEEARARVEAVRSHAAVVIDTPGVSLAEPEEIDALADDLETLGLWEVHLALEATLSGPAAREQLEALAPLGTSRIVLTRAEETHHIGPVIALAIGEAMPISYVAPAPGRVQPADARALAGRLLP